MILAVDIGTADLGWAVVEPRTARLAALGQLHQEPDAELGVTTSRAVRSFQAAAVLAAATREHGCTAIAAEAMSTTRGRFTMAISVGLSFGVVAGVAAALGVPLLVVPPKRWQHPVLGREPGDRRKVEYSDVERALARYVADQGGRAAEQLAAIPRRLRNHALDAVGVGAFTALRPDEATRIGGSR